MRDNRMEQMIYSLKRNSHINNDEDAILVIEALKDKISNDLDDIKSCIDNDLCVFREKDHAFDWFFDNEGEGKIDIDSIDFEIDSDMIGMNIKDILLDNKENYIKVKDNIHLTYWY